MAERFSKLYRIGKAGAGMTDAQCAEIAGVCPKTLYNAKQDPFDRITIGQLYRLGTAFGWSEDDYLIVFGLKQ